ncbi:MAG: carbamate kinase [Planctomycetota bacterium]|nr:carbamate kinase [Planctomycetota bacterium]
MSGANAKLLVVALGGNAISKPGEPPDIPNQFKTTAETAKSLADLIEAGHRIVITHGNGPQVGKVLRRVELSVPTVYPLPLEICVADTQGGMGYMIAQCLGNELHRRGLPGRVTAVVTTICVDRHDPAFDSPTKPIGSFYDKQAADELQRNDGWVMTEVLIGQYRRVVPSPAPIEIMEKEAIKKLVAGGEIVITCGGGGVPVVRNDDGQYQGVAAVIDKDLASALLARDIAADGMIVLTSIARVCLNFEKPNQTELDRLTLDEARRHLAAGQFPPGSMGPKIESAVQFLENSQNPDAFVLIATPERLREALDGKTGTRITRA